MWKVSTLLREWEWPVRSMSTTPEPWSGNTEAGQERVGLTCGFLSCLMSCPSYPGKRMLSISRGEEIDLKS